MYYMQSSANCKPYSSHEDEYISSHELHGGVSSCLSQNNSTAKKLNGKSISRRSCYCSTERPCKSKSFLEEENLILVIYDIWFLSMQYNCEGLALTMFSFCIVLKRKERINKRLWVLLKLVPNGTNIAFFSRWHWQCLRC